MHNQINWKIVELLQKEVEEKENLAYAPICQNGVVIEEILS
jgi:hypothetical protein